MCLATVMRNRVGESLEIADSRGLIIRGSPSQRMTPRVPSRSPTAPSGYCVRCLGNTTSGAAAVEIDHHGLYPIASAFFPTRDARAQYHPLARSRPGLHDARNAPVGIRRSSPRLCAAHANRVCTLRRLLSIGVPAIGRLSSILYHGVIYSSMGAHSPESSASPCQHASRRVHDHPDFIGPVRESHRAGHESADRAKRAGNDCLATTVRYFTVAPRARVRTWTLQRSASRGPEGHRHLRLLRHHENTALRCRA